MITSEVGMHRRIRGVLGVVAALGLAAAACAEDPLSGLDGSPAALRASFSSATVQVGKTTSLRASVLDGRSTPLETPVTFAACDADISVVTDPSFDPVPPTASQVIITGVTADSSCVDLSGGGQQLRVTVVVTP